MRVVEGRVVVELALAVTVHTPEGRARGVLQRLGGHVPHDVVGAGWRGHAQRARYDSWFEHWVRGGADGGIPPALSAPTAEMVEEMADGDGVGA